MSLILNNKFLTNITLIILGILSSFSLPPYNFFFINFFTFPLFFYILVTNSNQNLFNNFLIGWLYGFGYFLSNLYWISYSLKFDENFENLIIPSIILIPALLSIFYGLFSLCINFFNMRMNFNSILTFSLTLSLFEYLRGTIFGGFPWNLISFSISNFNHSIQILNLLGTYSLNLIVINLYCLPIILLFKIKIHKKVVIFLTIIVILSINANYGHNRVKHIEQTNKKEIFPSIKLISPKFNIERFFIGEPIENRLNELIKISSPLNKDFLLIYPEGITTISELKKSSNNFDQISNQLTDQSKIIMGISLENGEKIFNSLALFDKNFLIEDRYHKNKLVPFGEFLPFESILSKLGLKKITQGYKPFSNSNERNIITVNSTSFLPLICYEIIFSGQLNKNKYEYDFILNISEDGWFGNSVGPVQHFSHSIFRSIEEGKDVLRVANNGISAHISSTGIIRNKLNTTEKGSIEINTISKVFPTLFSTFGNKIFFCLVFFYITLIFFLKKIK